MKFMSWGLYPKIKSDVLSFGKEDDIKRCVKESKTFIPCGNGRSYGDSALNTRIINVNSNKKIIDFDEDSGLLHIQSGALLSEVIEEFVPRGWFLKVTPGTKLITIGGAIASDVHGKNHHKIGCFSDCVKEFRLLTENSGVVYCSKTETEEIFRATCGGQGLTGIILDAKIYLKRIQSQYVEQTTIKTKNLKETLEMFEKYKDSTYSVAWIDCLAQGKNRGRSLLMLGEFAKDGQLDYRGKKAINIPFYFPSMLLNRWSVSLFNFLFYIKVIKKVSKRRVGLDSFFYPLDVLGHWNRIYGKNGFLQYQFVLPKRSSYEGLKEILEIIADSKKGAFLSVLKLFGKGNDNYLSFPMEGYSLALDFKIEKGIFELLDRLDDIVVKHRGKVYLAKDARISKGVFEKLYPQIQRFRHFRKKSNMDKKLQSLQSKRVGI